MNCPNDRYVSDAEICQGIAAMLAHQREGEPDSRVEGDLLPKILSRNTSYLLGWTPSTTDAHDPLNALMTPPADGRAGRAVQPGLVQQPKLDRLTLKISRKSTRPSATRGRTRSTPMTSGTCRCQQRCRGG
jgi:peptide/nickel transport system substrate-binding protein